MEANTTGRIQCRKCHSVYAPVIKVLERVCPQCLSMKIVRLDNGQAGIARGH
jgi:Zn finger protein HypA/HybF involved in hydrogenase expression